MINRPLDKRSDAEYLLWGIKMSFKKLTPVASAAIWGLTAVTAPSIASADMTATIAASNFYLWRGKNLSNGAAAVSGSLDYSHESGLYGGVWTSSEHNVSKVGAGPSPRSEYDLYVGHSGEFGDVAYDFSLWSYQYPEEIGHDNIGSTSEAIIGLSVSDITFTYYQSLQDSNTVHLTFVYQMDKLDVTLGGSIVDSEADRTYFNIGYAATDEVSFIFSKLVDAPTSIDDDLLINVTWSKSFDI